MLTFPPSSHPRDPAKRPREGRRAETWLIQRRRGSSGVTPSAGVLTQGSRVVRISDALGSELLQQRHGRQLLHQVHRQGVVLLERSQRRSDLENPTRESRLPPGPARGCRRNGPDSASQARRSLTLPNSEDQFTTIVLGTVADSRASGVMLTGRLGRLGSVPFFVGGR